MMGLLGDIGDRITGFLGIGGPDPTEAQQAQYQRALEMLQSYRPRAMQAREAGLAHSLSALGPANEYLKQMYGDEFGLDLQALSQPGVASYLTDPASLQTAPQPPGPISMEEGLRRPGGIFGMRQGPMPQAGPFGDLNGDGFLGRR